MGSSTGWVFNEQIGPKWQVSQTINVALLQEILDLRNRTKTYDTALYGGAGQVVSVVAGSSAQE